jgi:hypothetical protein
MPQLSTRTVAKFSAQFYVSQRPWRREEVAVAPHQSFSPALHWLRHVNPRRFVLHFVLVSVTESYMKHVPRANFLGVCSSAGKHDINRSHC